MLVLAVQPAKTAMWLGSFLQFFIFWRDRTRHNLPRVGFVSSFFPLSRYSVVKERARFPESPNDTPGSPRSRPHVSSKMLQAQSQRAFSRGVNGPRDGRHPS